VVSNAERRALVLDEEVAVPRITDIYASLPAITGKMELEYEGELQGPERIANELIGQACLATFEEKAGGADVEEIVEYFEEGGALQVGEEASADACLMGFETVPGLLELVESVGLASSGDHAGARVAACELVLEALVADKRVSRSSAGGYSRARHEGPSGGGGFGTFDPFGGKEF
jgi:magnesium chelatase subunit I